jgi:hypothetical protein
LENSIFESIGKYDELQIDDTWEDPSSYNLPIFKQQTVVGNIKKPLDWE